MRQIMAWLRAMALVALASSGACIEGSELEEEGSTGPVSFPLVALAPDAAERVTEALGPIPLTRVSVRARVTGSLAEVAVEQTFENRLEQPLEAVYVFPLPDDAAVHEMVLLVGERRLTAELREREEAEEAYRLAASTGRTASLLEQERPNVFTMHVANIRPGQAVRVLIRYVEELPYSDGRYHFHFPTTVGPRFIPGREIGRRGLGVFADTTEVPDASRLTPAVLPAGVHTPYQVDFHCEVDAAFDVREPESTSHDLLYRRQGSRSIAFSLRPEDRQPNRDIELSYALASNGPAIGMMAHYDEARGGFFTLAFEPPIDVDDRDVRPKEMVFVVDTSGSMAGAPLETAKAAVRHALRNMNPDDTFQIVGFSQVVSTCARAPLSNTSANVEQGLSFVDSMAAGGGTVMAAGIHAALAPRHDPDRVRIVLMLTDGFIGNDEAILRQIESEVGPSRLFSLGVGSSVNRFLLDRMAERGRGAVHYVNLGQPADEVVETFYERIRNPLLTDIRVDFNGFPVEDVQPDPELIADVFSGTPIVLAGRYREGGPARATIRGLLGTRPVVHDLDLLFPKEGADRPAIAHLWARREIEAIEARNWRVPAAARSEVLPLALRFGLLTRHTAFVAVEERIDPGAGDPLVTIGVPVALPAGASDELVGPQIIGPLSPAWSDTFAPARGAGASPTSNAASPLFSIGRIASSGLSPQNVAALSGSGGFTPGVRAPAGGRATVSDAAGAVRVDGALSREVVRRRFSRYLHRLGRCYERALATTPTLTGRLVVQFTIAPTGGVRSVTVRSSTLDSRDAEACVVQAIRTIRFPRPSDGGEVVVSYPLRFHRTP